MDAGSRGDDAFGEVVHAEALERIGVKMTVEHFVGVVSGEHPVIENGKKRLAAEQFDEVAPFVALHEHFRRIKALQQFVDILVVALGEVELAGGDIQKRHARNLLVKMHRGEEVVFFLFQHAVVVGHTWGHQLDDTAFH